MTGRTIVANLDAEADWARAARGEAKALSRDARRLIAGLGTTLRVFAAPGDALVPAEPVDPSRLPSRESVPELPDANAVTFVLAPRPGDALLAWGETPAVARARSFPEKPPPDDPDAPEWERVWSYPHADPEVAGAVNFRGFQCDLARALGCALQGATVLESAAALRDHLARGGAAASPHGRFVLKAAWSAAGRARVVLSEGDDLAPADALIRRWGAVLFEPWMDRVADFGALGVVREEDVLVQGLHRQRVDGAGKFSGIVVLRGRSTAGALGALDRVTIEETARAVGERLHDAGYRGPFGIDAWTHRVAGQVRLHPLGEINARLTMGFVARAAVERLAGRYPEDAPVSLFVGRGAPPPDAVPLLLPGADDDTSAWIAEDAPDGAPAAR